eukprot:m.45033 g.45033  ORF g.45033 m.45033 type:complete len:102 (+) comp10649_c0_seq2:53-358(+)
MCICTLLFFYVQSLFVHFHLFTIYYFLSVSCCHKLAQEYGVAFMETSAKSKINVEEAFTDIARAIKKKIDDKVVDVPVSKPGTQPFPANAKSSSSGDGKCC